MRLLRISCLAVVVSLILLERAGVVLGQEFSVTPSDRGTHFVNVREEPSADSERLARLHPGERLPLIESVPRWHEVRPDDGRSGFVSKSWTVVVPGPPPASDEELRIHILSVGAGTCTVVECPGPGAPPMIVDCGSPGGGEMAIGQDEAREYVADILSGHAAPPNLVLSHGDTDHYNWTPFVLEDVTVQNIWQGGEAETYGSMKSSSTATVRRRTSETDALPSTRCAPIAQFGKTSHHAPAWIELKDIAQPGSGRRRGIDGEKT